LSDVEIRFRQRELDLISNPDVRQRFVIRSRLVSSMRSFLDKDGFLEVETPVLQTLAGGAAARPFVTHHNALGIDLYLRIAPELFLKRLVIGGMEKVYEIARCFRNEGIDHSHNPEFTQIELYWAYAGKERFLSFIESMVTTMLTDTFGSTIVTRESGNLDFTGPWPRLTFREAILNACNIDIDTIKNREDLIAAVKKNKVKVDLSKSVGLGEELDELYKKTARAKLTGPVWVLDYPVAMKPLAGRSPEDPDKSATAQLVVDGAEIINAYYYELNDPIDQRSRFDEQQKLSEQGSEEAQPKDEEFLNALEHGMPPTSGMGMGIDRLVAILTSAPSLKEVILFPTLRPKQEE
jgi:lysyl-tRNA synthetase class 2